MRSIFLLACAAAAVFVLPAEQAKANHYHEILSVSCEYSEAADLFHRSLGRCRRATDYSERLAQRLSCAAGDLHGAIRVGEDPRRIAVLYDEVYLLHDRLSELLGSRCSQPDPTVLHYWRPLDLAFDRLVCAIEGCQTVCPLISYRRQTVARPPVAIGHPRTIGPEFPGHFQTGPSWGGFTWGPQPNLDRRDQGRRDDFGRDWGQRDRGGLDWGQRDLNQRDRDSHRDRDFNHDRDFNRDRDVNRDRDRDRSDLRRDFERSRLEPPRLDPRERGGNIGRGPSSNETRAAVVQSILSRLFD